ncbi:MAG: immunoglobulin-like domain-containing protein [Lachnospiraceae bacterium]|jgi:tight adherence protein C
MTAAASQGRKKTTIPDYWKKGAFAAAAALLLFFADWALALYSGGDVSTLQREAHSRTVELLAQAEDGTPAQITVQVHPTVLTEDEAARLAEETAASLRTDILGENPDLSSVTQNLNLFTETAAGQVAISWHSSAPDILDASGRVNTDGILSGEAREVRLSAQIQAGSISRLEKIDVTVRAPQRSSSEEWEAQVRQAVAAAEENSRTEEELTLPDTVGGQAVTFAIGEETKPPWGILIIGGAAAALFPAFARQKSRQDEKKRRNLLEEDYSELVLKITLFIGAGMTVRKAFERIADAYRNDRRAGVTEARPAYEAITQTVRALKLGAPETESWVRFGEACGTREYRKLGSCLAENQRKGSGQLGRVLEAEAAGSFEERKRQARRRGEEAATKLILPLMMMLGAVMMIILVPALMSFAV